MIKITHWSVTFESADTRKRQRLGWYLHPTGCESKGYRRLMKKKQEGVLAFAVFVALCQYTGQLDATRRGQMVHSNGKLMDLEDLADLTRMPEQIIADGLDVLAGVGWIEFIDEGGGRNLPPTAEDVPPTAGGMPPAAGPKTGRNLPPTADGMPPTADGMPPTADGVPPGGGSTGKHVANDQPGGADVGAPGRNLPPGAESLLQGEGEGEGEVPPNPPGGDGEGVEHCAEFLAEMWPKRSKVRMAMEHIRQQLTLSNDPAKLWGRMLAGTVQMAEAVKRHQAAKNRFCPGAYKFFTEEQWADDPEAFEARFQKPKEETPDWKKVQERRQEFDSIDEEESRKLFEQATGRKACES